MADFLCRHLGAIVGILAAGFLLFVACVFVRLANSYDNPAGGEVNMVNGVEVFEVEHNGKKYLVFEGSYSLGVVPLEDE